MIVKVLTVQKALKEADFYTGEPNGLFGNISKAQRISLLLARFP